MRYTLNIPRKSQYKNITVPNWSKNNIFVMQTIFSNTVMFCRGAIELSGKQAASSNCFNGKTRDWGLYISEAQ